MSTANATIGFHIVAGTPEGLHFDNRWSVSAANATIGCHIVADTPEGLHLGNRWSVSVANATTGCYSLSHHTPKGGYTREEQ